MNLKDSVAVLYTTTGVLVAVLQPGQDEDPNDWREHILIAPDPPMELPFGARPVACILKAEIADAIAAELEWYETLTGQKVGTLDTSKMWLAPIAPPTDE